MFGRRQRRGSSNGPTPTDSSQDVLLAETIARHFHGATVDGTVARLGATGLAIACDVHNTNALGRYHMASLYLSLTGGRLGSEPIFASVSGYESTPEAAIVTGACNWACAFGPVITDLAVPPQTRGFPDAEQFEVRLDGRRYRCTVAAVDRAMMFVDNDDPRNRIAAARARFGAQPWLTQVVLSSDTLPVLASPDATLLSVFVMDTPTGRTVEVKVNGADWLGSANVFARPDPEPAGAVTLLRELALLVPLDPSPPLTRAGLRRTFAGLDPVNGEPWQTAGWQGWRAHRGVLADPITASELDSIGLPLPADYRAFLLDVAASGAGPGYGLLPPRRHGDEIPLAHAGCGVTWVLRPNGEVWVDAAGSDETVSRVAGSFTEWYRAWLDAAVRQRGPWAQWDNGYCATSSVLSQVLDQTHPGETGPISLANEIGPGAIALAGGGSYLPPRSALDPCHPCVAMVGRFGLTPDVFAPGILSR